MIRLPIASGAVSALRSDVSEKIMVSIAGERNLHMGLTNTSTRNGVLSHCGLYIEKTSIQDKVIALAGNPNGGKSTVLMH